MPPADRARPLRLGPVAACVLVAVLVASGIVGVVGSSTAAPATADGVAQRVPQTWVVDAVDDGSPFPRWVSRDTGTSSLTIAPGDTVEWRAVVGTAVQGHDLAPDPDAPPWQPPLSGYVAPGGDSEVHSYTFEEPGTYDYICSLHTSPGTTGMRGRITVEEPEATNRPPTAEPMVSVSGTTAAFMAHAGDPDGDALSYAWDFGTGDPTGGSTQPDPIHVYDGPGTYLVTLEVSDGEGGVVRRTLTVVVGGDGGTGDPVMTVTADAAPSGGAAPLDVQLGATVAGAPRTAGLILPFSHGLTAYPDLRGAGTMSRSTGSTTTSITLEGLQPEASHQVHVHEQACGDLDGGAHFRFDETMPFAEPNEIWLPFETDADGESGVVTVTKPRRAGTQAVSIVVHDPDQPGKRIGCVDLAPTDVAYSWDFGDGTTGTGPAPEHTYPTAGTYTATVTALSHHESATAEVEVVVADATPPQTRVVAGPSGTVRNDRATFRLAGSEAGGTLECRLDGEAWTRCPAAVTYRRLSDGVHTVRVRATDPAGNTDTSPAVRRWTVDTTAPTVRGAAPTGTVRDRTPTLRAVVTDRHAGVRRTALQLRLDGRRVARVRHDARRGRLTWTPPRPLARGRHTVRLRVVDTVGNAAVRTWRFTVR